MKSLILLVTILLAGNGAHAGKVHLLRQATKSITGSHTSSGILKAKIIDGLEFVDDTRNQGLLHKLLKKDNFESTAFARKVGYAEVKGVTGYYDNGVKNYYLRLELDGYSDEELRILARNLHESGVVRFNTGSKSVEINLLKDLSNTNQLDQRLSDIGETLVDFFKKTDEQKSMIEQVISTRRSVYQYEGAR